MRRSRMYLYEGVLLLDAVELCLEDDVLDGVVPGRSQVGHCTLRLGRQHHVVLDQVVLLVEDVYVTLLSIYVAGWGRGV